MYDLLLPHPSLNEHVHICQPLAAAGKVFVCVLEKAIVNVIALQLTFSHSVLLCYSVCFFVSSSH